MRASFTAISNRRTSAGQPSQRRAPPTGMAPQSAAEVAAAPDLVKVLDFGIAKSDDVDDGPRVGKR